MARKGITKNEVKLSANGFVKEGLLPTAAGIRERLGRGSLTTIQKYFREWKKESYQNIVTPKSGSLAEEGLLKEPSVKLQALEKRLMELEEHNKALNQELMKKEQENLKLNKENLQLSQNLKELTDTYKNLSIRFESLNNAYKDLKCERDSTLEKMMSDKNRQIERLTQELKEVNGTHFNILREVGRKGDEALIQEKVACINLKEKVNELQKQIKLMEERLILEAKAKEPLQREIKQQKALIDHFITWEQLQSFKGVEK